jgi:cell division protein FtsI/penicillin-binding protein 2
MKFAKFRNLAFLILLVSTTVNAQENPVLQKLLEERLNNCNCSAVIVDPERGTLLAALNPDPILKEEHPSSSLMKIFTLMAYAQTHNGKFPEYYCPPSIATNSLGCWDRNGHGKVDAQKAVAFSCNVYFRQLAEQTSAETFGEILHQFGITQSAESNDPNVLHKVMTGSTTDWNVSPFKVLRAYCSIFNGGKL